MKSSLLLSYDSIFAEADKQFWNPGDVPVNLLDIKDEQFIFYSSKKQTYNHKSLKRVNTILVKNKKNGEQLWCDISNSIIEIVEEQHVGQGMRIIKNNKVLEFFGYVDLWFKELKKYCILQNIKTRYQIGKKIGSGSFANVYKMTRICDQQEFAVKIYDKNSDKFDRDCVKQELEICRKMDHHNVNQLLETYESKQYLFMVQELFQFGNLHTMLRTTQFTEQDSIKGIYTLLEALVSIHEKGIIHRDIKPENILFRQSNLNEMIISDFGLADYYNEEGIYKYQRSGTPGNMAPEVLQDKKYDYKVDIFGLGIIFYQMLTSGNSPFSNSDYQLILQSNQKGQIDFSDLKASPQVLTLLKKMLDPDPLTRCSAQEAKQDKVFKKFNRQTIIIKRKKFIQDQTFSSFSRSSNSIYQSSPHYLTPPIQVASPIQNHTSSHRATRIPVRLTSFERATFYSPKDTYSAIKSASNLKRTLKISRKNANKTSMYFAITSHKVLI